MKNQTLINFLMKRHGIRVNQSQAEAVADTENCMVESGPGTGKSNVVCAKVAWLSHLDPSTRILVLSFSKRAVNELQQRLINARCNNAVVMTCHAWMLRLLKSYDSNYRSFKIMETEADRRTLMRLAIADAHVEAQVGVNDLMDALAKGKPSVDEVDKAIVAYMELAKERRVLDFDLISYFLLELLEYSPNMVQKINNNLDALICDEAQDNNFLFQNVLDKLFLSGTSKVSLTMVGNVDQSIYGFRGADLATYSSMRSKMGNVHYLKENYRSRPRIMAVCNDICPSGNKLKAVKIDNGFDPEFTLLESPQKEADYIIEKITCLHNKHQIPYRQMAILFRSAPAVEVLFKRLMEQKVPVVRVGCDALYYSNSRFKALLSLLALKYDPNHAGLYYGCALPILSIPNSILQYLVDTERNGKPLKELLMEIPSLSKAQKARVKSFFDIDVKKLSFQEVVKKLWNDYLKGYYRCEVSDDSIYERYLEIIGDNNSFEELRDTVIAYRQQIRHMKQLEARGEDYLRLESIHAAKGQQFLVTFVAAANEGVLPCTKEGVSLAEEERLGYVALSRAEEMLFVTASKTNSLGQSQEPSRFFKHFFKN